MFGAFSAAMRRGLIEPELSEDLYSEAVKIFRGHAPRPH